MSQRCWTYGNLITLLENGEAFFPAVWEAINAAKDSIVIETFILLDDGVGHQLKSSLLSATERGVQVDLTVDGYGSAPLGKEFLDELVAAGIKVHVFGPVRPVVGEKTDLFRRLHRKLVVVDQDVGFIGGINFSDAHLRSYGEKSKQDYAVRVRGPIVEIMHRFCMDAIGSHSMPGKRRKLRDYLRWLPSKLTTPDSEAQALLVWRDNHNQRTAIEAMYRMGLQNARGDVTIMNAYFFPGYRFLRAMRRAVLRGVRVRVILQGNPDMDYVKFAGSTLYDYLLGSGVEIWEYMERPSHAKVAVMGDQWATVGSSNLDPFSLSLNLEANLIVRDQDFVADLRGRLESLIKNHCRQVTRSEVRHRHPVWHLWRWFAYHLLRHFPRLANLIPVKANRLRTMEAESPSERGR